MTETQTSHRIRPSRRYVYIRIYLPVEFLIEVYQIYTGVQFSGVTRRLTMTSGSAGNFEAAGCIIYFPEIMNVLRTCDRRIILLKNVK